MIRNLSSEDAMCIYGGEITEDTSLAYDVTYIIVSGVKKLVNWITSD